MQCRAFLRVLRHRVSLGELVKKDVLEENLPRRSVLGRSQEHVKRKQGKSASQSKLQLKPALVILCAGSLVLYLQAAGATTREARGDLPSWAVGSVV